MGRILATADIGSNTVHLLVAETNGRTLRRLRNESEWLSLGETVIREGHIPEPVLERLVRTLKAYRAIAQSAKAERFYVFATEAVRLAANHEQVMARIESEVRVPVDLISPRREAEFSRRGVTLDSRLPGRTVLIEVGGGSVQAARCEEGEIAEEASLPLGTGRLIVESGFSQPASEGQLESLRTRIRQGVSPLRRWDPVDGIVACGGVARGLIRALHPDGDRWLHRNEIDYLAWATARLSPERVSQRFSVKIRRASTLAPGALLYRHFLDVLGQSVLLVSECGVREGAILEMAENGADFVRTSRALGAG